MSNYFLGSALPLYTAMFVRPYVRLLVRIRKKVNCVRTAFYRVAVIFFYLSTKITRCQCNRNLVRGKKGLKGDQQLFQQSKSVFVMAFPVNIRIWEDIGCRWGAWRWGLSLRLSKTACGLSKKANMASPGSPMWGLSVLQLSTRGHMTPGGLVGGRQYQSFWEIMSEKKGNFEFCWNWGCQDF